MAIKMKIVKLDFDMQLEGLEVEVPSEPPKGWTIDKSLQMVNQGWQKQQDITKELLSELQMAHDVLVRPGTRKDINPNKMTWGDYIKQLLWSRSTVHRWLKILNEDDAINDESETSKIDEKSSDTSGPDENGTVASEIEKKSSETLGSGENDSESESKSEYDELFEKVKLFDIKLECPGCNSKFTYEDATVLIRSEIKEHIRNLRKKEIRSESRFKKAA